MVLGRDLRLGFCGFAGAWFGSVVECVRFAFVWVLWVDWWGLYGFSMVVLFVLCFTFLCCLGCSDLYWLGFR